MERARAMRDLGSSYDRDGNLRAGLDYLLKAVEMDPENAELHNEVALVYRNLRQYKQSLFHFKKAL